MKRIVGYIYKGCLFIFAGMRKYPAKVKMLNTKNHWKVKNDFINTGAKDKRYLKLKVAAAIS
jgi:hypothetical protein